MRLAAIVLSLAACSPAISMKEDVGGGSAGGNSAGGNSAGGNSAGGNSAGGNSDGGLVDSGLVGSGLVDSGLVDSGLVDGGLSDGGLVDGGLVDGGLVDGGLVDGGLVDGGLVDAGLVDGGLVDGGASDAGALCFVSPVPSDGGRFQLVLPFAPNGVYDPDLEAEPDGGLVLAYSGVDGPPGSGLVSTHLARSSDRGVTWCEVGVVNRAEPLSSSQLPPGVAADGGHWNHETPAIAFDPLAPAAARWRLVWHRYLHADLPDGGDGRRFEYGWIAQRTAATPEGLVTAPERKLFSTLAYRATPAIQAWNDGAAGGFPRQDLFVSTPNGCLGAAEPTMLAVGGELYVALFCYVTELQQDIVLLRLNRSTGSFDFLGTLLGVAQAKAFNPFLSAFNAPDLVARGAEIRLLISPVTSTLYVGCLSYPVTNLSTATVASQPTFGISQTPGVDVLQTGACTWHDASVLGVVSGDIVRNGVQFVLFGSGQLP